MSDIIEIRGVKYEIATCITCGVIFTVPQGMINHQREKGGYHHCCNGHSQGWSKESSQSEVVRRERDRLKQQLAQKDDEIAAARRRTEEEMDARHKAEKKLKVAAKRASAGTCPCCNRTISQMARHMRTKHPTFIAEAVSDRPSPPTGRRQ